MCVDCVPEISWIKLNVQWLTKLYESTVKHYLSSFHFYIFETIKPQLLCKSLN